MPVTEPRADPSGSGQPSGAEPYADTWVVLPTYNEAENVERIGRAILDRLPGATLLTDRVEGQSKMSRRIVAEALVVVLQLRFDELRDRSPVRRRRQGPRPAGDQGHIP